MPISKKYRNDPTVQKALADAWLNLIDEKKSRESGVIKYTIDEDRLGNPLNWPPEFNNCPEQYITWVMSQPDYFYFVCKEIMGITLSPTQCVVLKELWNRKFPMYIASRGFGKALEPDSPIRTRDGWVKIKDISPGDKVYGSDGKLCNVTGVTHLQKDLDFYKITFQDGRTINCCKDHQWKVWDVTSRKWEVKKTIDMFGNFFWEKKKSDRASSHIEYRYAIPINKPLENDILAHPLFFPACKVEYSEYNQYTYDSTLAAEQASSYHRALGYYVEQNESTLKVYGQKPAKSSHVKSKLSKVFITNIEYIGKKDGMCIMVDSPDHTYITKDYIVTHNSFLLGVYNLLRLMFMPGRKIVIAGAAFRQSRIIFEYMENIYNNAPLLRDLFGNSKKAIKHETDAHRFYFNESVAIAIPIGNGEKIRGLRANDLQVDEFNSISRELFETVLVGFTAVSSNPIKNQQEAAIRKIAKMMNWWEEDMFDTTLGDNQLIISGTAGYSFQPFYTYWKDWHDIVTSRGDKKKLEHFFNRRSQASGMEVDEIANSLNYKDYSIIRIPIEKIPDGVMDMGSVSRARATMHSGTYQNEYGACFSNDSNGFFKRALLEHCTVTENSKIEFKSCGIVEFEAMLYGDPTRQYVFGVDPASEVDNLALVIVEMWPEHRRIVYCWTINKKRQREEVKAGLTTETDYFAYCARKIRNLMKRFPCARIMMDSQGGGHALMEAFRNKKNLEEGEVILLPVVDPDKPKESDMYEGNHVVELINFRDNQWVGEANTGMRKDFENRILLFPKFDAITLAKSEFYDSNVAHINDSLEDASLEIKELKDELSNIIQSKTPSGLDRWDTPEEVLPGGKKGRMKKDRYSALLMANMGARQLMAEQFLTPFEGWGGWSGANKEHTGSLYTSPFFSKWAEECYSDY